MAKKRQKFTYKDVKKPDRFVVIMTKFLDLVKAYGLWVVSGIAAGLIALLMIYLLSEWDESRKEKESKRYDELYAKIASFNAGYAEGIEEFMRKGAESFTEEEMLKLGELVAKRKVELGDMLKGVEEFYTSSGDSQTGMLATLYAAALQMESGNFQDAVTKIEAFLEKNPGTPLRSILYENLGILRGRMGDTDGAVKSFEKMAAGEGTLIRAMALVHTGDLFNPSLSKKEGVSNPAKAKEYYEKALAEFPAEDMLLALSERHIKNLAKERLINLK